MLSALELENFKGIGARQRIEFATPGSIERFDRDLFQFPFPDIDDHVESAWIELTVRFRTTPTFRGPLVDRAVIGVNKATEPLVWLEMGASLREGEPLMARVNLGHPLIAKEAIEITSAWEQAAVPEDAVRRFLAAEGAGFGLSSGQLMN